MGDKISTIILNVDLECRKCYKKISKIICKLQERESIQTVNFDEKNNTVTISGPFDPKKLCKKLCCKACKVIKGIQIKEEKPKPKPKPKPTPTPPPTPTPTPTPPPPPTPTPPPPPKPRCTCGCQPCHWGCSGDYKCPWCGRGFGWLPECPPPVICAAPPPYPCGGYKNCTYICEDPQPSCSIM